MKSECCMSYSEIEHKSQMPCNDGKRFGNIEALRVGLMFLVVLGHVCLYGHFSGSLLAKGMHTCTIFAVDTFALISGWFGIKFSWGRIAKFMWLGLFCSLVLWGLSDSQEGFHYSLGWFGLAYFALMFLAPALKDFSSSRSYFIYAGIMVVNWLPIGWLGINLKIPGWGGTTFNTIMFMYVTGRFLRSATRIDSFTLRQCAVSAVILLSACCAWSAIGGFSEYGTAQYFIFIGSLDNNSPLVIALSIAVFLFFLRIPVPCFISKICTFLSPSMFSVYLLHDGCNGPLSRSFYAKWMCDDFGLGWIGCMLSVILTTIMIMVACIFIDLLRRIIELLLRFKWDIVR